MAERQRRFSDFGIEHILVLISGVGLSLLTVSFLYCATNSSILSQDKIVVLLGFIAIALGAGHFMSTSRDIGDIFDSSWFGYLYSIVGILMLMILLGYVISGFLTGDISIVFTEGV